MLDFMMVAYIDGACFGNPGPMGIGVVLYRDGKKIKEISEYVGEGTNNVAEYSAFIRALEEAKKTGEKKFIVRTDSQLLANQVNGVYKVRDKKLKPLKAKADLLMRLFELKVEHIPRERNAEADRLSKKGAEKAQSKGKL